ncbi:MAG TPA: YbhB/YbcL family Raf kinase inhibitor-like protein, partial [Caldimonas sp.]|nr:YbhB/YbcL family Raf kinase inhibitor-like protein [Caldimonas sp.]
MKHKQSAPVIALAAATFALLAASGEDVRAQAAAFTLSSPDLPGNVIPTKFILNGFGCTGANVSPALVWGNVPAGTKSLALQVHDPDAPTGSGFWHWAVYDMAPTTNGLAQGAGNAPASLPPGAYGGNTDFLDTGATGANGNYGGPCPPQGDRPHRYVFTLYALAVDKVAAAGGIPKT